MKKWKHRGTIWKLRLCLPMLVLIRGRRALADAVPINDADMYSKYYLDYWWLELAFLAMAGLMVAFIVAALHFIRCQKKAEQEKKLRERRDCIEEETKDDII